MKISFITKNGNIPIKHVFTDVLAAYTKDGIFHIHTIVRDEHVVNKFPWRDIFDMVHAYPA